MSIGDETGWAQQHSQQHHSICNCRSDCKTETQASFKCLSFSCSDAHRSDRASRASLQALHYKCCIYAHLTNPAAAYQIEGGHHGHEHCSIFMVALISCGVKKELPSYSALQHSFSQSLQALPNLVAQLVDFRHWQPCCNATHVLWADMNQTAFAKIL